MVPALAALGAWLAEHGFSFLAGFAGGLLAVFLHDRWRVVRRHPDEEGKD